MVVIAWTDGQVMNIVELSLTTTPLWHSVALSLTTYSAYARTEQGGSLIVTVVMLLRESGSGQNLVKPPLDLNYGNAFFVVALLFHRSYIEWTSYILLVGDLGTIYDQMDKSQQT